MTFNHQAERPIHRGENGTAHLARAHSPTPWSIQSHSVGDAAWTEYTIRGDGDASCPAAVVTAHNPADAAFILRAVNAHDALVAALDRLTGSMLLHEGSDIAGRDLGTWDAEALIAARAALKLARGDA